jgi:exodeoxyribonuclease V alpha subunit
MQNIYLSEIKTRHIDQYGVSWIVGDRVMLTVNNKSINIMNGEEGIITAIIPDGVKIKFGSNEHLFGWSNNSFNNDALTMHNICHSFAVTAHKSQGSEYPYVIAYIPIHGRNLDTKFINANLLYMILTRTKRSMWMIGNNEVITRAITRYQPKRIEKLTNRLAILREPRIEDPLIDLCRPPIYDPEEYYEDIEQ